MFIELEYEDVEKIEEVLTEVAMSSGNKSLVRIVKSLRHQLDDYDEQG